MITSLLNMLIIMMSKDTLIKNNEKEKPTEGNKRQIFNSNFDRCCDRLVVDLEVCEESFLLYY
jgi:hypothetical protein